MVDYQIGYTKGEGLTPSQPTWESEAPTGVEFQLRRRNACGGFVSGYQHDQSGRLGNDWAWSDQFTALDTEFYTKADAEYEIGDGILQSIKVGGRYDQHSRKVFGFDEGTCTFLRRSVEHDLDGQMYPSNFASGINPPAGFLQNIWAPNWSLVQSLVLPTVTPYSPLANYWPGSFAVKESVWAGYIMANLGGQNWKGNVGVRYVDTQEDVSSYVSDGNGTSTCRSPAQYPTITAATTGWHQPHLHRPAAERELQLRL